jgi:heat shock protein HslJ
MILSFFTGASAPFFVRLASIYCILFFVLTACQSKKEVAEETQKTADILGQKWELTRMNSEAIKTSLYTHGLPYIEFGSESKISGFTGCNSFNGMFQMKDSLRIKPGAMTKMYCPNVPESEFIQLLSSANKINFVEQELQLMDRTKELLRFTPAKE